MDIVKKILLILENHEMICSIVISLTGLLIDFYLAIKIRKQEKRRALLNFTCRIDNERKLTEKEEKKYGINSVPIPILIKNTSGGMCKEIFIFIVNDRNDTYIKCKGKNLGKLQASISSCQFKYIEELWDQEEKELLIRSGGHGMNRELGVVVAYTDAEGKEWVKDSNGKIYRTKNKLDKFLKLGLPLPGYKGM
nr:hypothetical protein [uncultured Merdimonas sp.]